MKKLFFLLVFIFTTLAFATPLPAQEVFQIKTSYLDANTFNVEWSIKPGYFIYKDRIHFEIIKESNIALGKISFPKALNKIDAQKNKLAIYRNKLLLTIPVLGEKPGESLINVHFQGCSDEGFCYPPEIRKIKLAINKDLTLISADLEPLPISNINETPHAIKTNIAATFTNHHWIVTFVIFFGFGLLLSFTPCVLPMVPILSGIVIGHGNNITPRKAFFLSLSYVLAMSVTYACVGAGVALLGKNVQIMAQSPWVISLFSLCFILLSLSMFGFYELRLPNSWHMKLTNLTRTRSSGHYLSAAVMGALSILILSPCVTAPLIGVLGYIANNGNVFYGILALFFVGLGMGTPLMLIGSQAGRWLPTSGPWMIMIKNFFGVTLLSIALYLMSRILPAEVTMLLWAIFLIFTGVFSGTLTKFGSETETNAHKLLRSVGIIFFIYGVLILIGLSMGQTNPLQPLAYLKPIDNNNNQNFSSSIKPHLVHSQAQLERVLDQSRGKPTLVDFYADWCTSCVIMEKTSLNTTSFQQALKNATWVKVDVSANTLDEQNLLKHYGIIGPPTFLFFDSKGQAMPELTLTGEVPLQTIIKNLETLN